MNMDEFEHEVSAEDWQWYELVSVEEAGIDSTVPAPPDEDEVKDILLREGIAPKRDWFEGCR